MPKRCTLILLLLSAMVAAPSIPAASLLPQPGAPGGVPGEDVPGEDSQPEYAPIVERELGFHDFSYRTLDGAQFELRGYAEGKRLVIVQYFAGWCANSNRNGHVVERLWSKYREQGLGVVGVAEYSDIDELRIHINRIGINYPVVIETSKHDQRKDSLHYRYRRAVGDKRKWGTPFYVIIDTRDIEAIQPKNLIAHRVYTVSGELAEAEADRFIREHIADSPRR